MQTKSPKIEGGGART